MEGGGRLLRNLPKQNKNPFTPMLKIPIPEGGGGQSTKFCYFKVLLIIVLKVLKSGGDPYEFYFLNVNLRKMIVARKKGEKEAPDVTCLLNYLRSFTLELSKYTLRKLPTLTSVEHRYQIYRNLCTNWPVKFRWNNETMRNVLHTTKLNEIKCRGLRGVALTNCSLL